MTRVRAGVLRQDGRRNAAFLEEIGLDPAPYLNSIYLAVMFARPGSRYWLRCSLRTISGTSASRW